ncbi:MAG: hypothetical protein ACI8RD_001176 [Bacillariaceae sp.]|jgi:hypothetical protein
MSQLILRENNKEFSNTKECVPPTQGARRKVIDSKRKLDFILLFFCREARTTLRGKLHHILPKEIKKYICKMHTKNTSSENNHH